jgi:hypothetical protein
MPVSSGRYSRGARKALITALCAILSLTLLASCGPKEPDWAEGLVLDPHVVKTYESEDWVWTGDPSRAISPDGKWLLLAEYGISKKVLAVPLSPKGAGGGQTGPGGDEVVTLTDDAVAFESSGDSAHYLPVGWLSDSRCVFLAEGFQGEGPHGGKAGVSVLSGNVTDGTVEEVSFVPVPEGQLREASIFAASSRLVLDLMGSVWTVDLSTGEAKALRELDTPDYEGLLIPKVSPDGSKCLYKSTVNGKSGLYLLDLETGEEKALAMDDDVLHLYPSWSPDGRLIATYTVARRPSSAGYDWWDYQVYPGDDVPMPWGTDIRVLDLKGNVVKKHSATDKILGLFKWSPDSKSLAFLTAPLIPAPDIDGNWEVAMPSADSVMVSPAGSEGAAVKIADIGEETPKTAQGYQSVSIVGFDPESRGVFYETMVEDVCWIWYGAKGQTGIQSVPDKPVIVTEGPWHDAPSVPSFRDSGRNLVAMIAGRGPELSLYLAGPTAIVNVASWDGITSLIVAYDEKTLVVNTFADNVYRLSIYEMHSASLKEP